MNGRWVQFLEVRGELSLRNLTTLLTMVVGSIIVLALTFMRDTSGHSELGEAVFSAYLLAGAGIYSFGKWQDDKTRRFEIDSTPPPAPVTNIDTATTVTTTQATP